MFQQHTVIFSMKFSCNKFRLCVFVSRFFRLRLGADFSRPQQNKFNFTSSHGHKFASRSKRSEMKIRRTKIREPFDGRNYSIPSTRHDLCEVKIRDKTAHRLHIAITKTQTFFSEKTLKFTKYFSANA